LSGVLGTFVGTFFAGLLHLKLIPAFENQTVIIALFIGVLTYIVGALLYRFVKMRNQKDAIDHEYVQSRLRSLETQLNPHFLFNALNSIAELIHHDKEKAETAILKVSAFLRNSMNEKALLCMEDEIRNVRDYVELENIRFSGKIKLHIENFPKGWSIPKFSIQLLVENAIKHGYNPSKEHLNIWISFDAEKKIITLKNDGNAMKSQKFGVGLSNLNQRVELLCRGKIEVINIDEPTFRIYAGDCNENINC
jgi:LytS/YehU family sensor histidine kinase